MCLIVKAARARVFERKWAVQNSRDGMANS
jgi:hypothetical protein